MGTIIENLIRIQQAKADIKTAIEAKGVEVPSSATIDTYDDYVTAITGGGGVEMPSKLEGITLNDYGIITSANIKSGVTSIDDGAFDSCCNLSAITIPSGVTSIGNGAFSGCYNLSAVAIPSGVTSIGPMAFYYCYSLTSVTVPDSVTYIGYSAFEGCGVLTSIHIPSGLTSIGDGVFNNCNSLSAITIPSGVTEIGGYAFNGCSSLSGITVEATTPPTLGEGAFDETNDCPIYVPATSVATYKSEWSAYEERIVAIPTPPTPPTPTGQTWVTIQAGEFIPEGSYVDLRVSSGTVANINDDEYMSIFVGDAFPYITFGSLCTEKQCPEGEEECNCLEEDPETGECIEYDENDCWCNTELECVTHSIGYSDTMNDYFDYNQESVSPFTYSDGYWNMNSSFDVEMTGDYYAPFDIEVLPATE